MSEETRQASLKLAVELEEEGQRYYRERAADAENPLARHLLETLAEQEIEHRDRVLKLAEGHGLPSDLQLETRDLESSVREVFESFSAEEREGWTTENVSVYEHAMELERKAYRLYRDLAEQSEDATEKRFFEALMREESMHLESLENVFLFFSSPGRWISVEESNRWNWMNA